MKSDMTEIHLVFEFVDEIAIILLLWMVSFALSISPSLSPSPSHFYLNWFDLVWFGSIRFGLRV